MILAASEYPHIIPNFNELYMPSSHSITVVYSSVASAAILLAVSTAIVFYKSSTNYTVIHACITAVFLPVSILVYLSTDSSRYKVAEYTYDYNQMISDYRLPLVNDPIHPIDQEQDFDASLVSTMASLTNTSQSRAQTTLGSTRAFSGHRPHKLNSFINLIDIIQDRFSCCGVNSFKDWIDGWKNYIPPSCCKEENRVKATGTSITSTWIDIFKVEPDHTFLYCDDTHAFDIGCLAALKADEKSRYSWLGNLMVFLILATIANTILSMLLFGLNKTDEIGYYDDNTELAVVGVSTKPRPSQPTITGITHRTSVVQTLGDAPVIVSKPSKESIASLSQAVRFNLSNSPRASISGPSKFSAAARRGSSFI